MRKKGDNEWMNLELALIIVIGLIIVTAIIKEMAVDNEHYHYLAALQEGRITEKQYDDWAHSRKSEGHEVFKRLLKRPYRNRKL